MNFSGAPGKASPIAKIRQKTRDITCIVRKNFFNRNHWDLGLTQRSGIKEEMRNYRKVEFKS